MSFTNLTPTQIGTQCLIGTIIVTPTGTVGATTGFLIVSNTAVPIRQVPGPGIQGVSLTQLNGRKAVLCGTFVQDVSGLTFSVTFAFPLPF